MKEVLEVPHEGPMKCIVFFVTFRRQKLAEREEFTKSKASSSLLSEDSSDLAGVRYRPKTRETKSTYEVLLSFIQAAIGDQVRTLIFCYANTCPTVGSNPVEDLKVFQTKLYSELQCFFFLT